MHGLKKCKRTAHYSFTHRKYKEVYFINQILLCFFTRNKATDTSYYSRKLAYSLVNLFPCLLTPTDYLR